MAPTDTLLQVARPQAKFLPKQVATFFFKRLVNDNNDPTGYFECKACGRSRKQAAGTGYTYLVNHVRNEHPTFEREMESSSASATGSFIPWVRQKASNRFAWLEWV
ncbi:hypothetical protein L915_19598, partial [Phytophthora nicotianae]